MAAAHGYLELLSERYAEALSPQGGHWLASAARAVERMQQLVDALLTYARAGQASFQPPPVALSDVIANVLSDLRPALEAASGEVVVPDDLPTVTGDETLLRQLLQNLIDNALKYGRPDRGCRVTVAASRAGPCWEGHGGRQRHRHPGAPPRLGVRDVRSTRPGGPQGPRHRPVHLPAHHGPP
jgi:signal transduction histidine kinase